MGGMVGLKCWWGVGNVRGTVGDDGGLGVADVCDLILEQHNEFRRRFAELDGMREAEGSVLAGVWRPLADLLEVHAVAEEKLFYPRLLEHGAEPVEETEDAVTDHNSITDAVERANGLAAGGSEWWEAVDRAREANSSHTAEEERGALADFRRNAPDELRHEIGAEWLAFPRQHHEIERENLEVVEYVEEHGDDQQVEEAKEMVEGD